MRYQVIWERICYDEFDNFDGQLREENFWVDAVDLEEAVQMAEVEVNRIILDRYKSVDNRNDFETNIIGLVDEDGKRYRVNGVSVRTDP